MRGEFVGFVLCGALDDATRKEIAAYIRPFEGRKVRVTVKEAKSKRSNRQNAYYWGVVIPAVLGLFLDAGNDVDAEGVHYYLKGEVGKMRDVVTLDGNPFIVLRSSTKLTTLEFEDYMEKIRAWAAGMGLVIPLPKEPQPEI